MRYVEFVTLFDPAVPYHRAHALKEGERNNVKVLKPSLWLLATFASATHAATDAELLAAVEARYPIYFCGQVTSGQHQQYNYRYYPETGNYVGIDVLGNVYVVGKSFGPTIRPMGSQQDYADAITAKQAPQSPLNSRAPLITISGVVTDQAGAPVAGVAINAFHHNDHVTVTAITDSNGAYTLSGLDSTNNSRFTSDYALYAEKAGLTLSPAGQGAGTATRFDFNGYYRSVVRFFPMPLVSVTTVNFVAARSGDKQTGLPRTGQKTSYALGDDASLGKGVAWPQTRFTNNDDGTVTDNLTGLIWLRDAGCLGTGNWNAALIAANGLANGACGLTDGSAAGEWHLPNINELESLIDISQNLPALAGGHPFTGVAATYWSSTTYTAGPFSAMAIRFTDGRWINGSGGAGDNYKEASNGVWAVKSGGPGKIAVLATGVYAGIGGRSFGRGDDASLQTGLHWTTTRFIDNGDGTLSDTVTGLVWLKQADCIKQDWSGALAAIDNLKDGECGLKDGSTAGQWRLPNRAEMLSISDRAPTFAQASYFSGIPGRDGVTVSSPVIFTGFMQTYYWTSSSVAADPTQAWSVYACDFGVYNILKADGQLYALAVRSQ